MTPQRKDDTLVDDGTTILAERCIDFNLGSQPVCHRIAPIEATMFGVKIGGNGNMIVMVGCLLESTS